MHRKSFFLFDTAAAQFKSSEVVHLSADDHSRIQPLMWCSFIYQCPAETVVNDRVVSDRSDDLTSIFPPVGRICLLWRRVAVFHSSFFIHVSVVCPAASRRESDRSCKSLVAFCWTVLTVLLLQRQTESERIYVWRSSRVLCWSSMPDMSEETFHSHCNFLFSRP